MRSLTAIGELALWLIGTWFATHVGSRLASTAAPIRLDNGGDDMSKLRIVPIPQQAIGYNPSSLVRGYWMDTANGVYVGCPSCGSRIPVSPPDHEISQEGSVHPCVTCPKLKCPWQEHIHLNDYMSFQ